MRAHYQKLSSCKKGRLTSSPINFWTKLLTKAIIEKAAERAGKNLGQYLNDDVRGFAQSQISQAEAAGQAVASPKDLQVQVEQLTQLVEGIAARMNEPARKGFWQRVFGN